MTDSQLDTILLGLNDKQKEAVTYGDGPLLIFAGAGSGKTRVLTHRIAYLVQKNNLSALNVLAVTFTNKAAKEMKERIERIVKTNTEEMWVGTFHSMCAKLLRLHGCPNGVRSNFSIYDTDDSVSVMKKVLAKTGVDEKRFTPALLLNAISAAKNNMQYPEEYTELADSYETQVIAKCYDEYTEQLISNNSLDFDDLIMQCVTLLRTNYDVLSQYQAQFKYVTGDEIQDCNYSQFEFLKLMSGRYKNLCIVGDDDQAIYSWRGANTSLMLNFHNVYKNAHIVKLEQNYRSTHHILSGAVAVVQNNERRKDKILWTEHKTGEQIRHITFRTETDESDFIARLISKTVNEGKGNYKNFAVLYRMNALSRAVEQSFIRARVPYKIVGGLKFFSRKEVKDAIAYLRVINNPLDSVSMRRIINLPSRGISEKTFGALETFSDEYEIDIWEALHKADVSGISAKAVLSVEAFVKLVEDFQKKSNELLVSDLIDYVLEKTGYYAMLEKEGPEEATQRLGNVEEIKSIAVAFQNRAELTLGAFLEKLGLMMDPDEDEEDAKNTVTLMSMHAAKGLEYDQVFMIGMEENIFPSGRALTEDANSLEEERRLCYVGITRAKRLLLCSSVNTRLLFGKPQNAPESRFISEIPTENMKRFVDKGAIVHEYRGSE